MTSERSIQFIKELRALASKYGMTIGGGGTPKEDRFNFGFRPVASEEGHTCHPCAKCAGG